MKSCISTESSRVIIIFKEVTLYNFFTGSCLIFVEWLLLSHYMNIFELLTDNVLHQKRSLWLVLMNNKRLKYYQAMTYFFSLKNFVQLEKIAEWNLYKNIPCFNALKFPYRLKNKTLQVIWYGGRGKKYL